MQYYEIKNSLSIACRSYDKKGLDSTVNDHSLRKNVALPLVYSVFLAHPIELTTMNKCIDIQELYS